jgi:hypothetical protein
VSAEVPDGLTPYEPGLMQATLDSIYSVDATASTTQSTNTSSIFSGRRFSPARSRSASSPPASTKKGGGGKAAPHEPRRPPHQDHLLEAQTSRRLRQRPYRRSARRGRRR